MAEKYTHTLTDLEVKIGITLDDVAAQLTRLAFIDNGQAVVMPQDIAPALAQSTARCAFAGKAASFAGFNELKMPVYRLDDTSA